MPVARLRRVLPRPRSGGPAGAALTLDPGPPRTSQLTACPRRGRRSALVRMAGTHMQSSFCSFACTGKGRRPRHASHQIKSPRRSVLTAFLRPLAPFAFCRLRGRQHLTVKRCRQRAVARRVRSRARRVGLALAAVKAALVPQRLFDGSPVRAAPSHGALVGSHGAAARLASRRLGAARSWENLPRAHTQGPWQLGHAQRTHSRCRPSQPPSPPACPTKPTPACARAHKHTHL